MHPTCCCLVHRSLVFRLPSLHSLFDSLEHSSNAICSSSNCLFSFLNILTLCWMRLDSIRRWQFLKLSHKQNMVNPGSIHLPPIPPRPFLHHWPWSPGSPKQVSRLAIEGDQIQRTATFQKTQGTFENPDTNRDSCISQKRTWGLYVLISLWYKKTHLGQNSLGVKRPKHHRIFLCFSWKPHL